MCGDAAPGARTVCRPSRLESVPGNRSGRGPRGSPGARARARPPARRAGAGSRADDASPSALRSSPGVAHIASRVRAARGPGPPGAPGAVPPVRRPGAERQAGERGAAAEHEALRERVGGEAVGAVEPGARALADREQAGDALGAPVEVGDDPAHHVVAGGGDRRHGHRVQPGLAQRGDDVREAAGVDAAHVQADRRRARARELVEDRARHGVARGELVDEALAVRAVQRGALAAHGLGDQEALSAREPDDGRRVELADFEVRQRGAGGLREHQPGSNGLAGWSCATTARRRRPWRARRRGRPDAAAVVEQQPAPSSIASAAARRVLEHLDAVLLGDDRRQLAQDPAAGRAPARMRDAAGAVAALEAEREVAVAVGVEAHADPLEVAEALRRLLAEHLGGRAAHDPAARGQRVLEVALRGVVGGERGGEAALRPVGGGLAERAARDQRDARTSPAAHRAA